jgi:1,4-alpha-glucan branching enzyme
MRTRVTFRFCHASAKSVALAGDFNAWSVTATPMTRDPVEGAWHVALELEPGRYEYKFFVDGSCWWNDPNAPKLPNVWGSENSYIDVQ